MFSWSVVESIDLQAVLMTWLETTSKSHLLFFPKIRPHFFGLRMDKYYKAITKAVNQVSILLLLLTRRKLRFTDYNCKLFSPKLFFSFILEEVTKKKKKKRKYIIERIKESIDSFREFKQFYNVWVRLKEKESSSSSHHHHYHHQPFYAMP